MGRTRVSSTTVAVVLVFLESLVLGQNRAETKTEMPKIDVHSVEWTQLQWLNQGVEQIGKPTCQNSRVSKDDLTVADLAGGKVAVIRVTRALRPKNGSNVKQIKEILKKVWQGKLLEGADCQILWSEVTFWSIQSELEFADGKEGALFTDGLHVALRAHDGAIWFSRLMPAAQ